MSEKSAAETPVAVLPTAVLVVEKFFGTFNKSERTLAAETSVHVQTALRNCLGAEERSLRVVLRGLGRLADMVPG